MINEELNCIIISVNLLFFLINLGFSIGGIIILNETNELLNKTGPQYHIWLCNLVLTILSVLSCFIALMTRCGVGIRNKINLERDRGADFVSLGISIWIFILWFDQLNITTFQENYHNLFFLTKIRVFYFLIIISLGIFIMMCYIVYRWFFVNSNSKRVTFRSYDSTDSVDSTATTVITDNSYKPPNYTLNPMV
ncbi:hypothetical protein CPAV1605_249 [seawater metagenome]|uniref:Uncharacterized protein n=1 Tax=seawater metagenome TaxID=1561972 RepID=A0A5E8CIL9_9ZZZZ